MDSALSLLLETGRSFDYAEVRDLAEPKPPEAPALVLSRTPDLKVYDGLLTVSLRVGGVRMMDTDTSVMQERIGQLCREFKMPTMGAQSVVRFTESGHGDALPTFLEVLERRANWEVGGYDVDIEAQNRFELRGKTATLAGRPDIIAHREDDGVIVDAKTGHESPSHAVQVMIYFSTPSPRRYSATGRTPRLRGLRLPTATTRCAFQRRPSLAKRSSRTWGRRDPAPLGRRTRETGAVRHRNAGTVILQPSIAHSALTKPPSPSAALLPTFESQPSNGRDSAWCGNRTTA